MALTLLRRRARGTILLALEARRVWVVVGLGSDVEAGRRIRLVGLEEATLFDVCRLKLGINMTYRRQDRCDEPRNEQNEDTTWHYNRLDDTLRNFKTTS